MFLRIWIVLFIIFISYTIGLYKFCDDGTILKPDENIIAGRNTWQEKNCQSCHQLYGLGGYMGPDLTNIISTNGVNRAKTFIKYGTGKMPDMSLSDEEVNNLIAYLSWIDKTGKSEITPDKIHWTGTYIIK